MASVIAFYAWLQFWAYDTISNFERCRWGIEMEQYRLLVTDLTNYGEQRCVAGVDLDRKVMIRPEPAPAAFWDQRFCGAGNVFLPGNIVAFNAQIPNPKTQLPHFNEDRVVTGDVAAVKTLSAEEFKSTLHAMNNLNRDQAFASPVKVDNNKAYLEVGTNRPSLNGLLILRDQIRFTSDTYGDKPAKPRCIVKLRDGGTINLSIAASDLRESFQVGGVRELEKTFSGKDKLIVGLGCARGFGNFANRCYMQINGMFAL